jgi:hypothetical protein
LVKSTAMVKARRSAGPAGKSPAGAGRSGTGKSSRQSGPPRSDREAGAGIEQPGGEQSGGDRPREDDPTAETAVLLDAVIHDLRTPLSAMSGWLEVLESHFGEADGIVGRALLGLRRGVDSQARGLNDLAAVLVKQRVDLEDNGERRFLEAMQLALKLLDARVDSHLDDRESARLKPFRTLDAAGTLACGNAGSSLIDACGTLLQAIAVAQADRDGALSVTAGPDKVLITLPGAGGDVSALTSLFFGLQGQGARRPDISAQELWLARATLLRCGLLLRMTSADGKGLHLLIEAAASRIR